MTSLSEMTLSLEGRASGSIIYTILATAISEWSKGIVITSARDSDEIESNVMYLRMSNEIHVLLGV